MRIRDVSELVDGTADPSFAVDDFHRIAAWNSAAAAMFALSAREAIGKQCNEVVQGTDECGAVCSADCTTQQAGRKRRAVGNFDLKVQTATDSDFKHSLGKYRRVPHPRQPRVRMIECPNIPHWGPHTGLG